MDGQTAKKQWAPPRLEQIEMVDTSANGKTMRASETEQGLAMSRS